jgi:signal transduction histidine kinase
VLGIAGMILDADSLRTRILPAAIDHTLARFFPEVAREDLALVVRDGHGEPVLSRGSLPGQDPVSQSLPFVFTDWTLELRSLPSGPERWARASFLFNMTLGVLLALVLAGGVALALHTADRRMRLSRMKSDFVSNVSHELRTPLASIRVFAEFLRLGRAQRPEQVREYGEYIDAESRRLTRLIDNILDFARIESGRKTYGFEDGDLREVVEAVLRTFEVRLQHSGFRVTFTPPAEPLPRVRMDPDALGQALHNLLDNAMKYSGESREIEVRLERAGGNVGLRVRDHGIGIDPAEQRKIFERFHRAGGSLVHDVKGSGLGLAIVQHIVAAHGGRVGVESVPGAGSTFWIELPIAPEVAPGTSEGREGAPRAESSPGASSVAPRPGRDGLTPAEREG